MTIIIFIILLIPLIFISFDCIYKFNIWQKRIYIGRWKDEKSWKISIEKRAKKWIKRTPIVPKNDNSRLILWDIINKKHKSSTIQSWQKAGLLMGIYANTENVKSQLAEKIKSSIFQVKDIDVALLAYALLNISNKKEELKECMDYVYNLILDVKQNNTTIPYRKGINDIRFVDTIGLVCPFLVKYGIIYDCEDAITLAQKQIEEYYSFKHPETNTVPHAYNIKQNTPLGIYDWGRGIGWYILGIIEVHKTLTDGELKKSLELKILELANVLEPYQLQSGGFSSSIFNNKMGAESSATVLCGLLYNHCYNITKNEKYAIITERTINQLMKYTQRNGSIDICQGDTKGIGNYSTCFNYMPFVQGLSLLLYNRHITTN